MTIHYLKHSLRSLVKNKTFSLLNIIGLSTSLACFAFIAVWVKNEMSYDKFNANYDRIYRLTNIEKTDAGVIETAVSSAPMAMALKNDYPEVEEAVRLDMHEEIIEHRGEQILQSNILVTDPSFFEVFSYHLSRGDASTALNEPYTIVLTESVAKKYFGDSDPIGQSLNIYMNDQGKGALYKVTGLIPDPPGNAHFAFSMIASFKTVEVANPDVLTVDGWGDASFYTYVLLKREVDHQTFSGKIRQFYAKYIGDRFKAWAPIYSYKLQPLRDIHLRSNLKYEIAATGNINQVYIFSTIGIFILLLAAINYINLATARATKRSKEVSIKKVVGAGRSQLVMQYILEAVVTAFIAFLLSIVFCFLLQPLFKEITSKDVSPLASPFLLIFTGSVAIVLGIISGIYPAFVISAFKPLRIIKGSFTSGAGGTLLRKSLVTAQFVITLVLITGIIVIYSQMSYVRHKDLGFRKDGLIYIAVNGNTDVINGYASFRNDLVSNPLIAGIAISNSMIGSGLGTGVSQTVDINNNPLQVNTARLRVDTNYLSVYGIKLVAGKNFHETVATDTIRQIIINESAVRNFGWKDPAFAIGKPFMMGNQKGIIRGVAKDFHFNSMHEAIQPLAIFPIQGNFSRIAINADVSDAGKTIALIGTVWKKHFASALFDYKFLDKQIWNSYQEEQRFSKIFSWFSLLSLLIACLGLYGLISYAATQKVKEIGIRKVLGASVKGIVVLLTSDFIKLLLLAFVIAVPAAWYIMDNWLQDFAYRITIGWWMFGLAGAIVLLIALLTVSFESIKAAIANPVKSLRTE